MEIYALDCLAVLYILVMNIALYIALSFLVLFSPAIWFFLIKKIMATKSKYWIIWSIIFIAPSIIMSMGAISIVSNKKIWKWKNFKPEIHQRVQTDTYEFVLARRTGQKRNIVTLYKYPKGLLKDIRLWIPYFVEGELDVKNENFFKVRYNPETKRITTHEKNKPDSN